MADISDAENAWISSQTHFEQWMDQYNQNWQKPKVNTAARLLWSRQPPAVQAELRKRMTPQATEQLDRLTGGK